MGFQWIAEHFQQFQIALLAIVMIFAWTQLRNRSSESNFRSRESERNDLNRLKNNTESLAEARLKKGSNAKSSSPTLSLPGIRLSGEPHEILGVDENATEAEILRAYKEKIKMFHPDRIQGQAREQIRFYEDASSKINLAKEAMIEKIRKS